jgi:hydroxymethylglutaryl-CoA lyase
MRLRPKPHTFGSRMNVRIVEVGPRDGLQNEATPVPAQTKISLIQRLVACGHSTVEATSFVSPQWVPQLADAAEVYAGVRELAQRAALPVLVPNLKGYERARAVGVQEIAVFGAASEAFSRKNINASISESIARFADVLNAARADGVKVLGCPYQGVVPLSDVVRVARALHELGCYEISLGDTIGIGTPAAAHAMLRAVAQEIPMGALAVHFHDTRGQALANILSCLELGVGVIDSAIAGLGGCPYARGASGNVATEDVVYMLHGQGLSTGLDLHALAETGAWISAELGRETMSKAGKALLA